MASASAPANNLAEQLSASASSLTEPPLAASTAEAVDLSAGAAIRGLLVLVPVLVLLLRRVQASSPAKKLNAVVTCIKFSFCRICLKSTCSCLFAFWSYVAGISRVRTRTWVKILRTRCYYSSESKKKNCVRLRLILVLVGKNLCVCSPNFGFSATTV